jgi:hypothetical protein
VENDSFVILTSGITIGKGINKRQEMDLDLDQGVDNWAILVGGNEEG